MRITKVLEVVSYIALITVCSLGAVRLWQFHPQQSSSAIPSVAAVPTNMSGRLAVNFESHKRWLVMVLSTECHFCIESIPFHQELVKEARNAGDIGLIAVFPQSRHEVEQFEASHQFFPDTVATDVGLNQLQIRGTPTLLLVDQHGAVLKHWEGRLPESKEKDVRTELGKKG